jgi:hypothetical protein
MSAAEIIEQIKALPREERAEVVEFVREMEHVTGADGPQYADEVAFNAASDRVFEKHDKLFRKLAE